MLKLLVHIYEIGDSSESQLVRGSFYIQTLIELWHAGIFKDVDLISALKCSNICECCRSSTSLVNNDYKFMDRKNGGDIGKDDPTISVSEDFIVHIEKLVSIVLTAFITFRLKFKSIG
jgi:hypothetical protein